MNQDVKIPEIVGRIRRSRRLPVEQREEIQLIREAEEINRRAAERAGAPAVVAPSFGAALAVGLGLAAVYVAGEILKGVNRAR